MHCNLLNYLAIIRINSSQSFHLTHMCFPSRIPYLFPSKVNRGELELVSTQDDMVCIRKLARQFRQYIRHGYNPMPSRSPPPLAALSPPSALSLTCLAPILLVLHGMFVGVADVPDAVPRRGLGEQPVARGEQLSPQLGVLAKLGHVARHYHVALDLVPAGVPEAVRRLAELLLLLGARRRHDPLLRCRMVEPSRLAVHHELLGAVKGDRVLAYVAAAGYFGGGFIVVYNKGGNLSLAHAEG